MECIKSHIDKKTLMCLLALSTLFLPGISADAFEPIYTEAEMEQISPTSPDPRVTFLAEGNEADYDYWDSVAFWANQNESSEILDSLGPRAIIEILEAESEFEPGDAQYVSNNSIDTAQFVNEVSAGNLVFITASFRPATMITTGIEEDNGAMPLLFDDPRVDPPLPVETGVITGQMTAALSTIGDGPHGSLGTGQGDFDYYATGSLDPGVTLEVDIDTFDNGLTLDSFVVIRNSLGEIVASNNDDENGFGGRDSYVSHFVETPGKYYISVSSVNTSIAAFTYDQADFPGSPFVSGSGGGYSTEGDYAITIRVSDLDYFSFHLNEGDVFGFGNVFQGSPVVSATLTGPPPNLQTVMRTSQNISYLYSEGHPFATNGPIHGGLIAPETGTYSLSMQGSAAADYVVDLRVLRPPLETSSQQVLYLTMWGDRLLQIYDLENGDVMNLSVYDNPTVNPANYNDSPYTDGDGAGPYPNIDLEVNPLIFYADEMFMLEEEHTIDPENNPIPPYYISDMEFFIGPGIVQRVKEHFPQVDVRLGPPITNTFDIDYVESYAEIVIGSEAAQVNINSLAVAESIDLGNFDITDHGIVMMDEITGAIPLIPFEYPRSPDNTIDEMNSNIVYTDMILGTIANITAHVAAHLFGVLHTDSVSFANNIMDPRLPSVFGVQAFYPITGTGLDGIFSTVDDDYPFFGVDEFFSPEGYIGPQDTDKTLFYSLGGNSTLSSMTSDFSNLFVDFNWSSDGNGSKPLPFNQLQLAIDMIDTGGTVNIASGTGDETFSGVGRIDRPMTLQSSSPSSGPIRIGDEARPNFLRAR